MVLTDDMIREYLAGHVDHDEAKITVEGAGL